MVGLLFLETYFKNVSYNNMIVLTTIKTAQTVRCILRAGGTPDYMILTDESTNIDVNVNVSSVIDLQYYLEIGGTFDLEEGHYYRLVIFDTNDVELYRDRIFCTDQVPADYTPNQNRYKSFSVPNDNEFLMY